MSRKTRLGTGVSLVVSALAAVVLSAQSASPQAPASTPSPQAPAAGDQRPVFRGTSNFVVVDVYARRDGKLVEGLTKADFQITEDGKPQSVETFEFIKSEPNAPDDERRDPTSQQDGDRQAADPHNRVFVVYLDPYHTDLVGSRDARRPILDFLNRTINAKDMFGVMTPETPVGSLVFARRTETLESELTKYATWGEAGRIQMARTPVEQKLDLCSRGGAPNLGARLITLYREELLIESLENLMVRLRDLKDERKNVLFVSEGWIPRAAARELANFSQGSVPVVGVGRGGRLGIGNTQTGTSDASWCDQQIGRLASIDFEDRFRNLLTTAVRANVAFFPIDVAGLDTAVGPAAMATRNTLRRLSDATDGVAVIGTNDLSGAVRRIADGISGFYLLGYYSTNPNNDGRYREIKVKTTQPKIDLSARKGYLAPTAAMAAAAIAPRVAAPVVPPEIEAELNRLARLRPNAELFGYGAASPSNLDVIVEIGSRQVEGGRWASGADVRVAVTASAGGAELVGTGKIEAGNRGVVVHVPIDGARGPWRVGLRVSGTGGLLEDRIEVAAPSPGLLGPPMAYRANPSPRAAVKPMADFQLRRTERLHVEWASPKALDRKEARLLDRRGQPMPQPAAVLDVDTPAGKSIAVDLVMGAFSEGDYVLELTASAGAETERKVLAFRVVR